MTNKQDSSAPNSPDLTRLSGEQAEERTAREGRTERLWFCEDCGRRRRMPAGFPPVAVCRGGHKNWQLCAEDDE
jgi:hypothetical protein